MSIANLGRAADRAGRQLRRLARGITTARRSVTPALAPADVARAVEQALDRKQAPRLVKKLQKELKAK